MLGKHAAPGQGQFLSGLILFILKSVVFGMVLILMFWALFVKVPEWWPSELATSTSNTQVSADSRIPTTLANTTTNILPDRSVTVPTTATDSTASSVTSILSTPSTTTSSTSMTTRTAAPTELLAPSEIEVRVMNSTKRNGLAARVTSELAALGYDVLLQGDTSNIATTTVYCIPGLQIEAEVLAAELPGTAAVQPNSTTDPLADFLVVLGSSYP